MQLALGTVQFGLNYGIANQHGQVEADQTEKILTQAWHDGVRLLDTAYSYGNAETLLGNYYQKHPKQTFQIVSKLSLKSQASLRDTSIILHQQFALTLQRLQSSAIYGLLLHNTQILQTSQGQNIWKDLCQLKAQGQIQKLGVSVYHPQQIDFLLANFDIDLIQLPLNIFDQRILQSGQLSRLQQKNIEIHVRSVFLQGLLLMPLVDACKKLPIAASALKQFHQVCQLHQTDALSLCLRFIYQQPALDQIIIGVQALQQYQQVAKAFNHAATAEDLDFSWCSQTDLAIIDPSRWR